MYNKRHYDLLWQDLKENAFNDCYNKTIVKMRFFDEIERYFTGLFKISKSSSTKLKQIENEFFQYLVRYGELFVTNINNKVQLWQVFNKYNNGLHVEAVTARLIHENNPNYNQSTPIVKLINNKQGIYLKWKPKVTPLIIEANQFINDQYNAYRIFANSTITDGKKFTYTTNNNDTETAQQEINSFLNVEQPYIININPLSNNKHVIQNKITPLEFGHDQGQATYNNLTNIRNFWKDVLGIVTPTDNKKERKNLTETFSENYNSENSEILVLRNLNNFADQWNNLYQDDLSFEESIELINLEGDTTYDTQQEQTDI